MLSIVSAWPSIKAEQQRHNVLELSRFQPLSTAGRRYFCTNLCQGEI